jgi:hypothetical protein
MSAKPENPPAFPRFEPIDQWDKDSERYREVIAPVDGMSLRDYFAIRAPEPTKEQIESAAESDRLANPHGDSHKPPRRSRLEIIAHYKYAYADAMLQERAK